MVLLAFAEGSIQLVPDGTIFLHIAMILVMIWILNRTLFRPINRILEERERKTGRGSGSAGDLLSQVDEKVSRYESALRETRSEGYRVMEAQRAEAMAARGSQINDVKAEVYSLIEEEKGSIKKQSDTARATLAEDAKKMAADITATILKNV